MTDTSRPCDEVELQADRLVGGGTCLAHHAGETWLVAGALPGETVRAVPVLRRGGVVQARATALLSAPHPARAAEPCPHAAECGGCDWPHVEALLGAPLKAEVAAGAARSARHLAELLAAAPVRSSPPAYRLRARLHWDPAGDRLGFFGPRSHRVSRVDHCRIVSPRLAAALPDLQRALADHCPEPVDLEWLESLDGVHAVAALRPRASGPSRVEPSWVPPRAALPTLDGMHRLTRSGQVQPGWGPEAVTMGLPVPLEVPVGSFFQVNRHLVRALFDRVGHLARAEDLPTWDLHAGVGFLAAAALAARGPGGDLTPLVLAEPYRVAARAAQRNLPGAAVAVGRTAEAYLDRHRRLPREALVLTDPPRSGLEPQLRTVLARWRPRRLVMLSCDPATWARDTAFLLEHGFALAHLELFDLFPSTHHVEVLALLETT